MINRDVKEISKSNFNSQAEVYDEKGDGKFTASMYNEIISRIKKAKPEFMLDLGCGTGNVLKKLVDTDIKLYGLDLSEKMISVAKESLNERAELIVGDSEKIPFAENMFDVVVCNASFHHYPNPSKVLSEVKRVLRKNGILILGDPSAPIILRQITNFYIKFANTGDFKIYSKKEIIELLNSNGFEVLEYKKLSVDKFILSAS